MHYLFKKAISQLLCLILIMSALPHFSFASEQSDSKLLELLTPVETNGSYWPFQEKVSEVNGGENSMTVSGQKYENGFKLGESAVTVYKLDGQYTKFYGSIGLDDASQSEASSVQITADNKVIAIIELTTSSGLKPFEVDLTNVKQLTIKTDSGNSEIDFVNPMVSSSPNPKHVVPDPNADPYLTDIMSIFSSKNMWPFNKASYSKLGEGNSMTMGGKAYLNGIKLGSGGFATIELAKKYGTLYFTLGLDDAQNTKDTTVTIKSDIGLEKSILLKSNTKPQLVKLNVKNLKTLTISTSAVGTEVNLAEMKLSTKELVAKPVTIKPYTVLINKKAVTMTLAPIEKNGILYLPLAETASKLGYKNIRFINDSYTHATVITYKNGDGYMYDHEELDYYIISFANGGYTPQTTEPYMTKPLVDKNVFYLPTAELKRQLGCSVSIDKNKRTITLGKATK